jgi:RimJ/RimL family protein N-acetyltransferase
MITCDHIVIRSAEFDDAEALWGFYKPGKPRTFQLGPNLELRIPTIDELKGLLDDPDRKLGEFYVIEDLEGLVIGCAVMRSATGNSPYAEALFAFFDESLYSSPAADETFEFIRKQAFTIKKRRKLIAHCLETEPAYREFLARHGYTSNGIQRELVYAGGRYYDLESLSLFPESSDE